MSDFLYRLAERTLGTALLVTPRQPGLFAPMEEPASAPPVPAPTGEPYAAAPPRAMRNAPTPLPQQGAADRAMAAVARAAMPAASRVAREAAASSMVDGLVSLTHSPVDTRAPDADRIVAPVLEADSPAHRFDVTDTASPTTPRSPVPLVSQSSTRGEWVPLITPAPHSGTVDSGMLAEAVTVPGPERSPEPSVSITIGHIEVRARVAPSRPEPRPRPQNVPGGSLGDYLKRGGGRP